MSPVDGIKKTKHQKIQIAEVEVLKDIKFEIEFGGLGLEQIGHRSVSESDSDAI